MFLFGKKKLPSLTPASDDRWSILKGDNNGNPMFIRLNSSAKSYMRHPDLTYRLGMAVPLLNPNDEGLPNDVESTQLTQIEDVIEAHLGSVSRLVLVITTSGMREFVVYTRSEAEGERIAAAVVSATSTHEVQHYVNQDAKWSTYAQFAK